MNIMNILIVDDDVLIRNWLSMFLKQIDSYDINLFEASDGVEALECCDSNEIELVLTDIKMPRKDGIQLIEELRVSHPTIKTAVLSSYFEFTYVRTALKLGSVDYILKPEMKMEDILSILNKLKFSAENEYSHLAPGECQSYARRNEALQQFLSKEINEAALWRYTELLEQQDICISIFKLKQSISRNDCYNVIKVCDNTLKGEHLCGYTFLTVEKYFIVLFNHHEQIEEQIKDGYERLLIIWSGNIERYLKYNVAYSMFTACPRVSDLFQKIDESYKLMQLRDYYMKQLGTYHCRYINSETSNKLMKAIQRLIDQKNPEEAIHQFVDNIDKLHAEHTFPRDIKTLAVYGITIFFTYHNFSSQDNTTQFQKYIELIYAASTYLELSEVIHQFSQNYKNSLSENARQIGPQVYRATNYINENYMEKLTLDQVASHVYLNKSYLSYLFKRQLNISFGDYLENVRITNAMNLIRSSDLPLSKIAEDVGFANQNYFTKVFKKRVGISPLKYRKNK